MENNFKYIFNGKEKSKEQFITLAKDSFKWFSDDTIQAVDFDSVSKFFSGEYKSDNEIDNHFKSVLENQEKQYPNLGDYLNKTIEEKENLQLLKDSVLDDNINYPKQLSDTLTIFSAETIEEVKEIANNIHRVNFCKDMEKREEKVFEDWNKKDYNTTTVKVNSSPDNLVKLNTLRDCVLNKDFKPNSLEEIANLISAKEGIKETENKVNYEELDWDYIDNMAERMSKNLAKYPPNNWKKKMEIKELAKSAIRHARKILQEIDGDEETLQEHSTALGCNGMMINYQLKNK